MSYNDVRAVKNKVQDDLLSIPGVVGVGVRNPNLVIYVDSEATARKIALSNTAQEVPVMVRVTGPIKALNMVAEPVRMLGANSQDPSSKYRPASAGASIGHYAITAGTYGCLALAGGVPVILSNNHVLANASSIQRANAKIGDAILQPGKYDGGTMSDAIGTLGKYVAIDENGSNRVDCAYAIPSNQSFVSDGMLNYEGVLQGSIVGQYGMEVYKSGRTTGLTQSTIIDLDASIKVSYENFEALFVNQIVVDSPDQSFGAGGDSVFGDSAMFFRINGELHYGTIEELMGSITSKSSIGTTDIWIEPNEELEVLSLKGKYFSDYHIDWARVSKVRKHFTDKDAYEVVVSTSRKIKVTGDHSLFRHNSNKKGSRAIPVTVRDLKTKNKPRLICPTDYGFEGNRKCFRGFEIPEETLVLAGLWVADGSFDHDRKVSISTGHDPQIISWLNDFAHSQLETVCQLRPNGDLRIGSVQLVKHLKLLGFVGDCYTKHVPNWLYTASKSQIGAFLKGYFTGDGCFKNTKKRQTQIACGSVNLELIKGIRELLLRLGIDATICTDNRMKTGYYTTRSQHTLLIDKKVAKEKFLKMVGFLKDGNVRLWAGRNYYAVTSRTLKTMMPLPYEMRWVYDLEVPETQNFIANGFVCHNSGSIIFTIDGDQLKAVALLFAGSDTIIIANKIQDVMNILGVNVPYTGGSGSLPSGGSLGALVGLGALAVGGYLAYNAFAPKGKRRIF